MTTDWQQISDRIRLVLETHRVELPNVTVEAVEHYLDHDEYEMALEGLCIDLMEQPDLQDVDWRECIVLCKSLDLDKESVFVPSFWQRLVARGSE